MPQRQYAQCQNVLNTGDSTVAVLGQVVDTPVAVQRLVPGMVQTDTVEMPQLQFIDIPVVAQRQLLVWMLTAVNLQRPVPAVLGEHPVRETVQVQFLAWFLTSNDVRDR